MKTNEQIKNLSINDLQKSLCGMISSIENKSILEFIFCIVEDAFLDKELFYGKKQ